MDKEWYEIRDLLFGENWRRRDIAKAIALAKHCSHPDAVLICNVLQNTNQVWTQGLLKKVFFEYAKRSNDLRALCFAWCFLENKGDQRRNFDYLKRASDAGFAFAQTQHFEFLYESTRSISNSELELLAEKAISKNERDGYLCLARLRGDKFLKAAKKGAKLGSVACMVIFGVNAEFSKDVITFLGQSAMFCSNAYINDYIERVFDPSYNYNWNIVTKDLQLLYLAGYYAKNLSLWPRPQTILILRVSLAVNFYTGQTAACRAAVDTWSLCALRLKLYKDIRILIAKIVWDSRSEALFDIPQ